MPTFSYDSGVVAILRKYPQFIAWDFLSYNPAAIEILKENQDKINWKNLSKNPSAIDLLEANQNKINWMNLSSNSAAVHLLKANQDKIDWSMLSTNPKAIDLLEANPDKIDWINLSGNPCAGDLIKKNLKKVISLTLLMNPNVLEIIQDLVDVHGNLRFRDDDFAGSVVKNVYSRIEMKLTKETWEIQRMIAGKGNSVAELSKLSGDPFACKYLAQLSPHSINWVSLCWYNYWDPYRHAHLFEEDSIEDNLELAMKSQIKFVDWYEAEIKLLTLKINEQKNRIEQLEEFA